MLFRSIWCSVSRSCFANVLAALASYFEFFKPEFKSIAFSGWGPELIPDDEILQSQFPEILAGMEQKRIRLAELSSLFAAADEEDYEDSDDTGVLPDAQVTALKAEIKEANGQARLAKREKRNLSQFEARAQVAEQRLAKHKALEDEAKQLKADLRADQRACLAALENLHAKYAVTAKLIETKRDAEAVKLKKFLVELGYE